MATRIDPQFVKAIILKSPLDVNDLLTLIREVHRLETLVEHYERKEVEVQPQDASVKESLDLLAKIAVQKLFFTERTDASGEQLFKDGYSTCKREIIAFLRSDVLGIPNGDYMADFLENHLK